jgi:hypothetical protein
MSDPGFAELGVVQTEIHIPKPVEQKRVVEASPTPAVNVDATTGKFIEGLHSAGIETRIVPLKNNTSFKEVIILDNKEPQSEKRVRVFRGITKLDASLLRQIPYAMRSNLESGSAFSTIEEVKPEVVALANEPSYQNLVNYMGKVTPHLNDHDRQRFSDRLTEVEDSILEGRSLRTELLMDQIRHPGGTVDNGIAPYVSATLDPLQASGYAEGGAVLVIDLPISKIDALKLDEGEIHIKGIVEPEDISAVLIPNKLDKNNPQTLEDFGMALTQLNEAADSNIYSATESRSIRAAELAISREMDVEQRKKDVEQIHIKRVNNLIGIYKEVGLDPQAIRDQAVKDNTDIYSTAKKDIFDYYVQKMKEIDPNGDEIRDYEYIPKRGLNEKFDRDSVTDEMLTQLKKLVVFKERRREIRAGRN